MFKFLHIADVHLDTSFYSKKEEVRQKLREGIRNSFQNAINLCIDEKVDALLIAGDLFDNDKLSFKTEQFLLREFNRLKEHNIMVFYANGNHDPGYKGNRINFIKWPDNVHVFKDDIINTIDLKNMKGETIAKITSCGHKSKNEGRNLIKDFPIKEDNVPHIGLVHTMIIGARESSNHEKYLPSSKEELEKKNYDYWALGHIHKRQIVSQDANIYYPGNIQGRSPRETGEKGGLLVSLDEREYINIEFRPLAQIQWHNIIVNKLEDIKNYRDLKIFLSEIINKYIEKNNLTPSKTILRIELEGRCLLKNDLEIEENREQILEELLLDLTLMDLELKTDLLKNTIETKDFKEGDHVLSYLLNYIDADGDKNELINKLIDIPFANEEIRNDREKLRYIEELMEELGEEAVNWMVGDISENK